MKSTPLSPRRRRVPDEWDRQWREHWSKVGMTGYELPIGGPGGDERDFLATARAGRGGAASQTNRKRV